MKMGMKLAALSAATLTSAAFAGYTNDFDWVNNTRNIHLVPDNRMDYDPRQVNVRFSPADVGSATLWDATKLAADAWNRATTPTLNNNWRFSYGGVVPAGAAIITVRMGALELVPGNPGNPRADENGVRRFRRPPSVGAKNDADGAGGNQGGMPNPNDPATDALGYFSVLGNAVNGQYATGEICFNPIATWATDGTVGRYNPVLLGMHELGHAMRLDHLGDGQMTQRADFQGNFVGSVMRPEQDTGIEQVNPFQDGANFRRYAPGAVDVTDSTGSSGDRVPAPSAAATLLLGGLFASRRRRAA